MNTMGLVLMIVVQQTPLSAREIVDRCVGNDSMGMADSEVQGRLILKDKKGVSSELGFSLLSFRYDPPLSRSIVRFTTPPDLAGAGFLMIQKKDGDDDRFLFLPELHKSRRISGNMRTGAFMGSDFSYADIDGRDVREGEAKLLREEKCGTAMCHVVEVIPKNQESEYSRLQLWIREDNFLGVRSEMYDKAQVRVKTMTIEDSKKVGARAIITRLRIVNHKDEHTTELILDQVHPRNSIPESEFTTRQLEKL